MYEWRKQIQVIVDEIDECIRQRDDEALTLNFLSRKLGYSDFHTTRKFKEISGMPFGIICAYGDWHLRLLKFVILREVFLTLH